MSEKASVDYMYDKAMCAKYRALTTFAFYPAGIRDFVFKRIRIRDNDRVLDAGCGFGVLSEAVHDKAKSGALSGVEQHAFDISPDMLDAFREMGLAGIDLRQLDVEALTYEDDYFDLILTSAMLEHVPDIDRALASLKRCLKPGGKIYIFMSRKSRLNRVLFRSFGNPNYYSPNMLRDILVSGTFKEIRRHYFPPSSFWLNAWGFVMHASK